MRRSAILGWIFFLLMAEPLEGAPASVQGSSPNGNQEKVSAGQQTATPGQNPDASGKYHVGDGVSAPKLLFAPDPEFTDKARRKRLQGTVIVALTVDAAGKTQEVHVSHSLGEGLSETQNYRGGPR